MKKLLVLVAAALVSLTVASASTLCVSTPISVGPGSSTASFTCGTLTFGDFMVTNITPNGVTLGRIDINNVTLESDGSVVIDTNPNLGAAQHEDFFFAVWGGVTAIDLSVGGTAATVTERACANPIATTGALANLCTDSTGTTNENPLGQITLHSGDPGQPVVAPFNNTNPIYIFKDISTGMNGGLSTMNQSFHTAVPEPVSFILLGSGLLGLGLLRRNRKR